MPPSDWYSNTPLSRNAAKYLWSGLATKTRELYSTATRSYTDFCALNGIKPPFPATLNSLSDWIAYLGDRHIQPKTIKAYLVGVRSTHIDLGFDAPEAFNHPALKRIINGIRRLRGEADAQERRPITRDVLLKLLSTFDQATLLGLPFMPLSALPLSALPLRPFYA